MLLALGRYAESLKESELYVRLDPLSPAAYDHLGFHYLAAGQYAQSIDAYRKTQLVDPAWESSHQWLASAYRHQGMTQQAIAEYERAMAADKTDAQVVTALRQAFEKDGWKRYWRKNLKNLLEESARQYVSPYLIAVQYALIDDQENAFRYLDKAYADHDYSSTFIKSDRDVDSLRADPRCAALLQRMGFLPRARIRDGPPQLGSPIRPARPLPGRLPPHVAKADNTPETPWPPFRMTPRRT